jgi:hypothetical protein
MRAADRAGTWSTFSCRGTTYSAWIQIRKRLSRRAASPHPSRRLSLRTTFGWKPSKQCPFQTRSPTSCSVAPCSTLRGLLFCRLASSIGMERQVQRIAGRRFLLPDGSQRYLVDEELLLRCTAELGGQLADPLKTTIVQNQRCMTTWIIRKNLSGECRLWATEAAGADHLRRLSCPTQACLGTLRS